MCASYHSVNGHTVPGKHKGKRPNVSFCDELEEDSHGANILTLAESTKKRCLLKSLSAECYSIHFLIDSEED